MLHVAQRTLEYHDAAGALRGRASVRAVHGWAGQPLGLQFELARRSVSCGVAIYDPRQRDGAQ